MIPNGVQAEIHDLDGMTVEGLKLLCARFGLTKKSLRDELIRRIKAELDEREESYSRGTQQWERGAPLGLQGEWGAQWRRCCGLHCRVLAAQNRGEDAAANSAAC